jgi:hypothetical protein
MTWVSSTTSDAGRGQFANTFKAFPCESNSHTRPFNNITLHGSTARNFEEICYEQLSRLCLHRNICDPGTSARLHPGLGMISTMGQSRSSINDRLVTARRHSHFPDEQLTLSSNCLIDNL